MGQAMTPDFQPPPPPDQEIQAEALRTAFPGYTVNIIVTGGKARFEAVRRDGGSPYCLISQDAREIWRELKGS
jgi:hypothetical protein